jgi:hypothetical protein
MQISCTQDKAYFTVIDSSADSVWFEQCKNISATHPALGTTFPKGTVKQVDWAANGANVVFTRKVERGGQILYNDTFRSNYRPWQAVYLVGTKEG